MNCLLILFDTIQQCSVDNCHSSSNILSSACEIATVVIAVVNVILLVRISNKGKEADVEKDERNRKLDLFKTLILDQNMSLFYKFFDDYSSECNKLLNTNELDSKKEIDSNLKEQTKLFRQKFICLLSAIDEQLYKDVLSATDDLLMDPITEAIFDEGINLTYKPKFEEKISKTIFDSKVKIINVLFHYQGKQ